MNGSLRPDLFNVVMAGGIGLVAVWGFDRIMRKFNLNKYTTSGT